MPRRVNPATTISLEVIVTQRVLHSALMRNKKGKMAALSSRHVWGCVNVTGLSWPEGKASEFVIAVRLSFTSCDLLPGMKKHDTRGSKLHEELDDKTVSCFCVRYQIQRSDPHSFQSKYRNTSQKGFFSLASSPQPHRAYTLVSHLSTQPARSQTFHLDNITYVK